VRSGEIHLVLNGGTRRLRGSRPQGIRCASDEAVSGDVSISAGNTQRHGGSESCVGGSPVSEADVGGEGNDCFLLIVQLKVRSQNVRSCKPPVGSSCRCSGGFHLTISNDLGGSTEGRHAVREDSTSESYGHTDCGPLSSSVVHELHTGVVNLTRGGGGGDHEGNPTRDSGDGSGRGGQGVTLEATALRKSRLGVPSGLDPASGALSNAIIDCSRVDLINSALSWEDEGNDLARDGSSDCTAGP